MTDYIASSTDMTTVANAIRSRSGTDEQLSFPNGMAQAIAALPSEATYKTIDGWDRPIDMPNIDALIENGWGYDYVCYLVYDTKYNEQSDIIPFLSIASNNHSSIHEARVDIGTVENGVFNPIDGYGAYIYNNNVYRVLLPLNYGRYLVARITNTVSFSMSLSTSPAINGSTYSSDCQNVVESYIHGFGLYLKDKTKHIYSDTMNYPFNTWSTVAWSLEYLTLKCTSINNYAQTYRGNPYTYYLNLSNAEGVTVGGRNQMNESGFTGYNRLKYLNLEGWDYSSQTSGSNLATSMPSLVDYYPPKNISCSFSCTGDNQLSVESLRRVAGLDPTYNGGILQLDEGVTATLTIGATNIAKLTAEEIQAINDKGWTLA